MATTMRHAALAVVVLAGGLWSGAAGAAPGSAPAPAGAAPGSAPAPAGAAPGSAPAPAGAAPGSAPAPAGAAPGAEARGGEAPPAADLLAGAGAADAGEPSERALTVGVKQAPPFAMTAPDGTWTGLGVELWRMVATDLRARFVLRPFEDVKALLDAVERRELDVAVGALTITPAREGRLDFTRPFHTTGLAIAVRADAGEVSPLAIARRVIGWPLVLGLGVLAALAVLLAAARALLARGLPARGLLALGAVVWIAAAVAVVAGVAAHAAAGAVREELGRAVGSPADLAHARVATVPGSTSADYLARRDIPFRPVAAPDDGLRALAAGEVDALVYDAPILRKLAAGGGAVVVLPGVFELQDYGFALSEGSPLREEIDRRLVDRLQGDAWRQLRERFLGAR